MANPIPHVAVTTGDVSEAPSGAIPISLYGVESSSVSFSEIEGTVSGVTGANLQAILNSIASRLAAVENP